MRTFLMLLVVLVIVAMSAPIAFGGECVGGVCKSRSVVRTPVRKIGPRHFGGDVIRHLLPRRSQAK
jgi:hypothetical protein